MKRLKLIVAYDGTHYHGFAKQPNAETIQSKLEQAIFEITQQHIQVFASGRTDTGVHARAQCCIIDIETRIPAERFGKALNSKLPNDIIVRHVEEVSQDFHPRFCVKKKTYRYQILTSKENDPFLRKYVYFYPRQLDVEQMKKAANYIIGTHDFNCFCASGATTKTTERTVYSLEINQIDDLIQIDICGNGFLYNMVRIIVGTLIDVGIGKMPAEKMEDVINSKDRGAAGKTAPASGLMMYEIQY